MKLKTSEIKAYRLEQLRKQGNICPLCMTKIEIGEATLDHCHSSGHVRHVLHRSCNGAEGQILKWAGRRSKGTCPKSFLKAMLRYWQIDMTDNPIHPTHGAKKRKTSSSKKSPASGKTTRGTRRKSKTTKSTPRSKK